MDWVFARRVLIVFLLVIDAAMFLVGRSTEHAVLAILPTRHVGSQVEVSTLPLETTSLPFLELTAFPSDPNDVVLSVFQNGYHVLTLSGGVELYSYGATQLRYTPPDTYVLVPRPAPVQGQLTAAQASAIAKRLAARIGGLPPGILWLPPVPQAQGGYLVVARQQIRNRALYGAGLQVSIDRDGVVQSLRMHAFQLQTTRRGPDIIPAPTAISQLVELGAISGSGAVQSVDLAYLAPQGSGRRWEVAPVWWVQTKGGAWPVDAFTGQVEAQQP